MGKFVKEIDVDAMKKCEQGSALVLVEVNEGVPVMMNIVGSAKDITFVLLMALGRCPQLRTAMETALAFKSEFPEEFAKIQEHLLEISIAQ